MSKVKSIPPITATGRELDVLVAERVFHARWSDTADFHGESWLQFSNRGTALAIRCRDGRVIYPVGMAFYSTDIAAAWSIVERMRTYRRGITPTFFFELQTTNGSDGSGVAARFVSSLHPAGYFAIAADAATAICIAALNALAEHYPEIESETTPPKHRRSNTRV